MVLKGVICKSTPGMLIRPTLHLGVGRPKYKHFETFAFFVMTPTRYSRPTTPPDSHSADDAVNPSFKGCTSSGHKTRTPAQMLTNNEERRNDGGKQHYLIDHHSLFVQPFASFIKHTNLSKCLTKCDTAASARQGLSVTGRVRVQNVGIHFAASAELNMLTPRKIRKSLESPHDSHGQWRSGQTDNDTLVQSGEGDLGAFDKYFVLILDDAGRL
ncbi:hypothetical protein K491DRAFT_738284 [Lophiostoma macrostomum CBS 122681]|uniref:Uncharacterized protein n=1 Tax=Lophiostoma macrostomum CBS 122681 TaxID=1314788 RepID=A0A6A6TEU9_9PLEO|nr:hypothetical protein K491DRAFT_738284 [Lophiostoma macrostomum CBS 122681]